MVVNSYDNTPYYSLVYSWLHYIKGGLEVSNIKFQATKTMEMIMKGISFSFRIILLILMLLFLLLISIYLALYWKEGIINTFKQFIS